MAYQHSINPKYTSDWTFNKKCIYCNETLLKTPVDKILNITLDDIRRNFNGHKIIMENVHGKFNENYFTILTELIYDFTLLYYCPICGWWKILEQYWVGAEWQMWDVIFGINGTLRNLDIKNMSTPLSEIRSFLIRNYEQRYNVNPRLFEEIVSDVYRDLGYESVCTSYSNDGGIDVILTTGDQTTGIQVKRTKNKIKVEQIRALLGALLINNYSSGIFISTSDFQKGAVNTAKSYNIDLVNGSRFYDQLKEAQLISSTRSKVDIAHVVKLYYDNCYPMNSL